MAAPQVTFRDDDLNVVPSTSLGLPAQAKTVDIESETRTQNMGNLATHMLELDHIRVFNFDKISQAFPFKARDTFIMSLNAFPGAATDISAHNDDAGFFSPRRELIHEGPKRLVLNIRTSGGYQEPSLSIAQQAPFGFPDTVKEVVFIFSEVPTPSIKTLTKTPRDRLQLFQTIIELIFDANHVKFTFVDMGYMRPRWKYNEVITEHDHDSMWESTTKAVWSTSEEMDGDDAKYADFDFLTREEYRKKVGDKQFALETMA
ncbi:uncharacterized protein EHS24_003770 [Apiotrichum porosum]|uniref:Uncharacterized protein n=1 Tax=Apiotrichum porosum TaxID=105984 RepID=A0A427XE10_9TREE|nr:uncharacterized protein EHS24_003770 [Apiotrichum porosum]RSH77139.1 hypothetical protein EHS24_003770 [Apiotrichum porosum]